jgi:sarcosine oxidase gamma subunit
MHAELTDFPDLQSSKAVPLPAKGATLQAMPVAGYLHLRSAGRGPELDGLTRMAQVSIGADLSRINALAPLLGGSATIDAFAMRTRPSEIVLFAVSADGRLDANRQAAFNTCQQAMANEPLLHAVDGRHGQAAWRLSGPQARSLLLRLGEATSLPQTPGCATRMRLAEMHVTLVWSDPESYLLLVDTLYADFLTDRLVHAAGALDSSL